MLRARVASLTLEVRARRNRRSLRHVAATEGRSVMASTLRLSASLGSGLGKISERRRVVLLSLLAAKISLRHARLRHQTGGLLRLDSLCRGGGRQFAWRLVFEPTAAAREFVELFA